MANIDASEIETILMHALSHKWTLQGFGMLRLYLSKTERLHVWHSQFKTDKVTVLHTHPWHFTSTVICGWIRNQVYTRRPTPNYMGGCFGYQEQTIRCGPGGCAMGDKKPVFLSRNERQVYTAGQSYSQKAEAIHETIYGDGTVSLIERTFLEDTEHAQVYIKDGESWVSAEPREASPKEVQRITSYALEVFNKEYNRG